MAAFALTGPSVSLSVCLPVGSSMISLSQSVQSLSVFSPIVFSLSVCLSILWPVHMSVWSISRSITLQSLVTVAV